MSTASTGRIARSYLFVPGARPDRFAKALAAGADRVILDLEDAVPPEGKDAARDAVTAWVSATHPVTVRINAAGTPWFAADVKACAHAGIEAIVLPKAEDPQVIAEVFAATGTRAAVLPLVETAQGLWKALDIARAPGVERLLFGTLDFQLDLGIRDDDLLHYRSQLVLVSRLADRLPPVDGVTPSFDDPAVLERDVLRARALGFGGKLCIHPRQVAAVNAAFRPSGEEIAWARRVVEADARAQGAAVAVDGKMVDRPVLLKAQGILADAD